MLNQILAELKEIKKLLKVIVGNKEQEENIHFKEIDDIKETTKRDQFGNRL